MREFIIFRKHKFSLLYEKKTFRIFIVMLFLSLFCILLSLSVGNVQFSITEVVKSLFGFSDDYNSLIINKFRLPRTLVGFLVGSSLALSGSILQGISKNPLASPDVIGIVNGGSVGVLLFLTLFTDTNSNSLTVSIFYTPIFALIGAFIVAIFIYITAFKNGVTPFRLILIGIAISGAAKALTTILIINGPMIFITDANIWLTGTIYGSNWNHVKLLSIWFSVFSVLTLMLIRHLNILSFNDELATGLGTNLEKNRLLFILLSTALASGAVAVGGGVSFVGLLAPHISRKLTNSSFENVLPISILIGGIIVVLADIVARNLFSPLDLPVGIFTASVGAPFFIYLLWKKQRG